jgi:hypothetical protein
MLTFVSLAAAELTNVIVHATTVHGPRELVVPESK